MQPADAEKGRGVLIVSYHFPPCNMVASVRSYSFAKYLAKAGYRVTVIAMDFSEAGVDATLQLDCSGFEVVRVEGGSKRLKHIDHYGREAQDAGISRFARKALSAGVQGAARLKNLCIGNLATPEDGWFPGALRLGRKLLAERDVDVLLTTQGPITAHLVGLKLKKEHRDLFWIADYRDPWSGNANFPPPKWPLSSLQAFIERRINDGADHITTVSQPLVDDYFNAYRDKTTVIENGYLPEDFPAGARDVSGAAARGGAAFVCSHTGTFYPDSYDLGPLLQAVDVLLQRRLFAADAFEIRCYGQNSYKLRKALKGEDGGIVKVFEGVTRAESLGIQRGSDALLLLSSDDPRYRGVYSSKVFEYLASGTPIVVIGNGEGNAAAELVRRAGAGFVCGKDVEKIVEAFRMIAAGDLPKRDDDVVASFSRERLAGKLMAVIESDGREDRNR